MRRLSATGIALAWAAFAFANPAAAEPAPAAPAPAPTSPDKETCVASFDRGQRAQSDRALRAALKDLIVCSQESCPNVLRADCAGVLAEVRSALPTIVPAADDGNGHELTDVKVYVGNELVAEKLDGRAIAVDPGTFELTFERAGQKALVTTRTIREGEKSRVIRVSLGGGAPTPSPSPSPSESRTTLGWVLPGALAALGLGGLGVALGTRLHYDGRVEDLRGSCAPDCTQEQRSDLSSMVVTSNVALGAGIGLLALAVTSFFLTTPSGSHASATKSARSPGSFAW